MSISTSVIISTWNRAASLRATLLAVDSQTAENFNVVVVCDGDHAETRELASSLVTKHRVDWIFHESHRGIAAARHTGALASDGDLLVFLDDDILVGEDWLTSHQRAHEANPGHVIVLGYLVEEYTFPATTRLEELMRRRRISGFESFHRRAIASGNSLAWFPHCGNNSSLFRATYEMFGGFDPAHVWIQQDVEAGERASRAGVRFVYEAAAKVVHMNDKTAGSYEAEGERKALADLHRLKVKRQLTSRTDSAKALFRGPIIRKARERLAWSSPDAAKKIANTLVAMAERTGSERMLDAGRNLGRSASYWDAMRAAGETLDSLQMIAGSPVPALLFHSVADTPRGEDRFYHISRSRFERALRLVEKKKLSTLTPDDFLGGQAGPRSVLLTFDDGYEDFYINAFPLLVDLGMRATVFIVADDIGGVTRWVSRRKERRLLRADQMLEMQKYGITFGSHSLSHPHLTDVDDARLRREVADSKQILEDMLGAEVSCFAYPAGRVDERVRSEVGLAGYRSGFTTRSGLNDWTDPLMLHRSSISEADSALDVELKLRTGRSAGENIHEILAAVGRGGTRILPGSVGQKAGEVLRRGDAHARRILWKRRTRSLQADRASHVLHVLGTANPGGIETYVLGLARMISKTDATMEVCILGPDGPVASELRDMGIRVHVAPVTDESPAAAVMRLRAIVAKGAFDVVHAHSGGRLFRYALKSASSAPLINHVHGFPDDWIDEIRAESDELRRRVAALDAGSDVIAVSSRWTSDILQSAGLRHHVNILPYGVENVGSRAKSATWSTTIGDAAVVGFVGRLIPRKGVQDFLELAQSLDGVANAKFVILGDGPLRSEVESRSASMPNVILADTGMKGAELMPLLDLLVVPSEWEPLGIVSLEAMAAGVPVVAFRVGGIPEVVIDGETGLLVDPLDASALREAVMRLLDDAELRKTMGEAGRERVKKNFTIDQAAAAAVSLYRTTLALNGAA